MPIIITGHLVLTTIHAKDTVSCLYQLIDLGVSIEELRQTVIGIVAQLLIQTPQKQEERCVLLEILSDVHLSKAIHAIRQKAIYELPHDLTFTGQIKILERQHYETTRAY